MATNPLFKRIKVPDNPLFNRDRTTPDFSDPQGQTRATPDHQRPSGGGQSIARPSKPTPSPTPTPTPKPEQPVKLGQKANVLTPQQRAIFAQVKARDTGVRTIVPGERVTAPAFTRRADLRKPGQFERETEIISQIQTTQPMARGLRTRGQFEQDTATIMYAEDLFQAQETQVIEPIEILSRQAQQKIDLGGDYDTINKRYQQESNKIIKDFNFEFGKSYQQKARDKFQTLPRSEKVKLNLLQTSQSTQKALINVATYPRQIFSGALTSYKEVDGKVTKSTPQFYESPIISKLKSQPDMVTLSSITQPKAFVKEKLTSPDLYGKAIVYAPLTLTAGLSVRNVIKEVKKGKSLGSVIKQGVADAAPFKIVEGVYTPKTSSINIISQRKVVDGITQRTFYGGKGSIDVRGFEVSKKGVSAGFIRTDRPFIEIRAGGGTIRSGTQTTFQPYTSGNVRTGQGTLFKDILGTKGRGSVANIKLTDGLTKLKYTEGGTKNIFSTGKQQSITGGFSKSLKQGEFFAVGKIQPQLSYKQIVKSPTVKGVEFDVGKSSNFFGGFKGSKTSPITTTKQQSVFTAPVQSQLTKSVTLAPQKPITTPLIFPIQQTRQTQSQFYGQGLYERTAPQLTRQTLSQQSLTSYKQNVIPMVSQVVRQTPSTRSKTRNIVLSDVVQRSDVVQKSRQQQMPRLTSKQQQRLMLKNIYAKPQSMPRVPTPKIPRIPKLTGGGLFGFGFKSSGRTKQPTPFGSFQVFGRRFGKFKVVGIGKTKGEAVLIGKNWAKQTLGVTFKIPGISKTKVTGFRTKKEDGQILFIEPRGQRLKRGTREIPEIQLYRGIKR